MRKDFHTLGDQTVLSVLVISMIFGCAAPVGDASIRLEPRDRFLRIFVDTRDVLDDEHGSDVAEALKSQLSKSFEDVSIGEWVGDLDPGVVILRLRDVHTSYHPAPKAADGFITTSRASLTVIGDSTVQLRGVGESEASLVWLTAIVAPLLMLTVVGVIPFPYVRKASHNGASIEALAIRLNNKLLSSTALRESSEHARLAGTRPAELALSVEFSDRDGFFPNNAIDAAEGSTIDLDLENEGEGTAFDVHIAVEVADEHVTAPKSVPVGDIPPGGTRQVAIEIEADADLRDGFAPVEIVAKEKRGYDSKTHALEIRTVAMRRPELSVARYKINDGKTGMASGNGNGVPENGETIELIPFVENRGVGEAVQVEVALESVSSGIDVRQRSATIPEIAPGRTATSRLVLHVPRTHSGESLEVELTASDVRGTATATRRLALATDVHRPVLSYTYRVLDRSGDGSVQTGEAGEIEIVPENKGEMDARGVELALRAGGISLSRKRAEVGRIGAGEKWVPLRFPFRVPRTLGSESVEVAVTISQDDFGNLEDRIRIPIAAVRPAFALSHQLLDGNGNGALEQGESASLVVRVRNTGDLDAEDVVLTLGVDKPGVILQGEKRVRIGRVAAGQSGATQRFSLFAQRRTETGSLPLRFQIAQRDFPNETLELALRVHGEEREVIRVGEGQPPESVLPTALPASLNTRPVIAIAAPADGRRVATESVVVQGRVADDRGVASIEVHRNGRLVGDGSRGLRAKRDESGHGRDFRITLPLDVGRNDVVVRAYDVDNQSSEQRITVFRETDTGELWAAVIGIDRYVHVPDLKYAVRDARAYAGYLRRNLGLDSDHLFELYDEEASLEGIRTVLGTRLPRKASRNEDTVFIFFAGHGAPERASHSLDSDGVTKYILPHGADPENLYATALPMDEIANIVRGIGAERVAFFVDSCFSGGSGGRTLLAANTRAAALSEGFLDRIAQGKGRKILTSSGSNEVSRESDELRHGFFTYFLIEGLNGAADLDADRSIYFDELSLYVKRQVRNATGGTQSPVEKGESEGRFFVGRVD